jgi:hypothetical protein
MFFIPGCAPLPRPATAPAPQLYLDPRLPDHARVCVRLQIGFHCPMTVGELRTLLRRYQRVAVEASR